MKRYFLFVACLLVMISSCMKNRGLQPYAPLQINSIDDVTDSIESNADKSLVFYITRIYDSDLDSSGHDTANSRKIAIFLTTTNRTKKTASIPTGEFEQDELAPVVFMKVGDDSVKLAMRRFPTYTLYCRERNYLEVDSTADYIIDIDMHMLSVLNIYEHATSLQIIKMLKMKNESNSQTNRLLFFLNDSLGIYSYRNMQLKDIVYPNKNFDCIDAKREYFDEKDIYIKRYSIGRKAWKMKRNKKVMYQMICVSR